MSRTGKSWLLLVSLTLGVGSLGAGCLQGGALDPFENVGGGNMMPPPSDVVTDLPACSEMVVAPCKIALSDLSFTDGGCMHTGDTVLVKTWNHPNDELGRLQFGASETSTLQLCQNYEHKICDMTLSALPPLFKSLTAGKIKLTFSDKHKFFSYFASSAGSISSAAVATGTLRFGGKEALSIAGTRTDSGGGLEQAAITAWIAPGADRSIGFRVTTDCAQAFAPNLGIYWSIEGMIAEMLP